MKKFTHYFLSVFMLSLFIVSCSKSEDSMPVSEPANNKLVKKIVRTTSDGDVLTLNITYEGNKIKEIISSLGNKEVYTYEDDLIVKLEEFNNNILKYLHNFRYENNKLKSEEAISYKINSSTNTNIAYYKNYTEYSNNNNGVVTGVSTGTDLEKNFNYPSSSFEITFFNGNLYKKVEINQPNPTIINYEYDNKINPLKFITGFNKFIYFSANNETKSTRVSSYTNSTGELITNTNVNRIEHTYNNDNLPIIFKKYGSNGELEQTMQYFY